MEEKKINFSPWMILLITVILIIVLSRFFREQYRSKVEYNISHLKKQIQKDLEKLRLAESLRLKLEKKAEGLFRRIFLLAFFIYVLINCLLITSGISFLDAIEGSGIIVGLSMTCISMILFNKINFNLLLERIQNRVLLYVYRKHGFSLNIISELKQDIRIKNEQLSLLEYELKRGSSL